VGPLSKKLIMSSLSLERTRSASGCAAPWLWTPVMATMSVMENLAGYL